jgi:predicted nucleic acid-binding protein
VLIAAARPGESAHARCAEALAAYGRGELGVPVTILAETMSFVGARLGIDQQRRLWDGFLASGIEVVPIDVHTLGLAREIDRRYADAGLGFADCTLLAACEVARVGTLLTLDGRLAAYRPGFTSALELRP